MDPHFARFGGNIPLNYDRGMGPYIFVDFARDLARRVAATSPRRLLEIAAGTGIVTRALRDAVPGATEITATDLNLPMLDVAREKFQAAERVTFQPADATALPFEDGAFDTAVCQFGVMFFPDKDKAYREVHRVLTPDGRYFFSVWDSFEHNPNARIQHETIGGFFPGDAPTFYTLPHGYHQPDPIYRSLAAAGFRNVTHAVVKLEKELQDIDRFAKGVVYGSPVFEEVKRRGGIDPDAIVAAIAAAFRRAFGEHPGRMPLQALVFSARKPR